MEAFEVVRVFANKTVVSNVSRRRGNPGYPRLQAVRLLKEIGTDKGIVRHLERNRIALGALGFKRVSHRTTVGRWWRRYAELLKEVFEMLAELLQHPLPCKLLVVDSTSLEDRRDPEAEWGFTSRGPFKGFKFHVAVNQEGLPLKALVSPGNRYDSPFLPALIYGLTPSLIVADAGYDSKENREAVKEAGAKLVIASNPRRKGRQYLVEQFHDLFKNQMLQGCWKRGKGLRRKAGQVYAALTGLLVTAFKALINEEESLNER